MPSGNGDLQLEELLEYLKHTRGFDFTGYKRPSLIRRVTKRFQQVGCESYADYKDYLEVHPDEFTYLFNTILINVTEFFRDPPAWDFLAQEIVSRIVAGKKEGDPIRVWSAGCASGEEVYALAMVLAESLGMEAFRSRVKIYATDIDEDALAQARQAMYGEKQVESVPPELLKKYFEKENERCVFRRELRRSVIVGRHDLLQDAPISRLDLLVCRNTLMYFNAESQARILARFHFALNEGGFLFLGRAETLLTHAELFAPVELKHRVFSKAHDLALRDQLLVMTQAGDNEAGHRLSRDLRLRETAFNLQPVAQLLLDAEGALLVANDRARHLLGMSNRDLGRPLTELEGYHRLPSELLSLVESIRRESRPLERLDVLRISARNETQHLDLELTPIVDAQESLVGISVTLDDVSAYHNLKAAHEQSQQELETANEELHSANEELTTTNEELQSTVEELETTNEELQSSNEEMETMNEELQSSNAELQAMNRELASRTEEVNKANTFLESILGSLRSGAVVLDPEQVILMWNSKAEDFWGLRRAEVTGRHFLSLDIGLPVEKLKVPIRACLAGGSGHEQMTLDAVNRRGKTFRCRVACAPLRSVGQEEAQGVILLMEEETA